MLVPETWKRKPVPGFPPVFRSPGPWLYFFRCVCYLKIRLQRAPRTRRPTLTDAAAITHPVRAAVWHGGGVFDRRPRVRTVLIKPSGTRVPALILRIQSTSRPLTTCRQVYARFLYAYSYTECTTRRLEYQIEKRKSLSTWYQWCAYFSTRYFFLRSSSRTIDKYLRVPGYPVVSMAIPGGHCRVRPSKSGGYPFVAGTPMDQPPPAEHPGPKYSARVKC